MTHECSMAHNREINTSSECCVTALEVEPPPHRERATCKLREWEWLHEEVRLYAKKTVKVSRHWARLQSVVTAAQLAVDRELACTSFTSGIHQN